jgi:hypothetical protein
MNEAVCIRHVPEVEQIVRFCANVQANSLFKHAWIASRDAKKRNG